MIRGDINVRAGGITWVSAEYDERTGAVLRPLTQDRAGMPLGLELQQRSEEMLRKAFFADKLQLPQRGGPQETAYEVGQRVQQYIRDALPLMEPVEIEFNGGVWERAFVVLRDEGVFGPPDSFPESLRGADIEFKFASPLREQIDKQKGQIFVEGVQLLQAGAALDPAVGNIPNAVVAMRDALEGIGWGAKWVRSPDEAKAASDAQAEQAQAQQMMSAMSQAASIAKDVGASKMPAEAVDL
jgi:Bacteriophage head to tail connecting protein